MHPGGVEGRGREGGCGRGSEMGPGGKTEAGERGGGVGGTISWIGEGDGVMRGGLVIRMARM